MRVLCDDTDIDIILYVYLFMHPSIDQSIHYFHRIYPSHVPVGSQIISETIMKDIHDFLSNYEAEMQSK